MEKALKKKTEREKGKAARAESKSHNESGKEAEKNSGSGLDKGKPDEVRTSMSDDGAANSNNISPTESLSGDLKRKREEGDDIGSPKKSRTAAFEAPPPPPPPPPSDSMPMDGDESSMTPEGFASESGMTNGIAVNGQTNQDSDGFATPSTYGSAGEDEINGKKPAVMRHQAWRGGRGR